MTSQDIAAALQRVESVFHRRPEAAFHDDAPGTVRWESGLRLVATHANGKQVLTDMPGEFGGTGDQVSPGWLVRSGLAACTASCIALAAAREGIELQALEVTASSRSDARGMLGMADADGQAVYPGPHDVQMHVRISAHGVSAQRLRSLVEDSNRRAPMTSAFKNALPVALHIEVGDA
ncbi:OsmC family protein [Polaromonas sp. YR568]|uniref:OsmC family protein n=1 Tax=Polaromonas sp. YR568 TaxID=1855301 RepID=UPI0031381DE3